MSSNLVNMAHTTTYRPQTGDYVQGQIQKESGYYRSHQDTSAFSFNDANLKLLNDYKQMNRMLMLALGQDINEIERIGGVRSMEEPEHLLSYLHSKGMLSHTELSDLKNIHTQNGAIKNAGSLSGHITSGANLAADYTVYKGYGSGTTLPNQVLPSQPQGYSSTYIYSQQTGKETTATPQKSQAVSPSFSASSSLQAIEKQLSASVVSTLKGCETLSSQRFYESLERFVKYKSGVADEAAIVDFLKRNSFDSYSIQIAESIGSYDKANSLKRQLDELSQMTENHRKEYISQLENTVKVHPLTSHYLSKLSPEKAFNGKNLDEVLANIERKFEMVATKNSSYEKVINDLEKKLLESNLKITSETENANRVLSMSKTKELRSQELASVVRKLCGLHHHHQYTEDYNNEVQALVKLETEILTIKQTIGSAAVAGPSQQDTRGLATENQSLQTRVGSLTASLSALKASNESLKSDKEEQGRLVSTLRTKITELESVLETRKANENSSNSELQRQVDEYEKKVRSCNAELETAKKTIENLEGYKESISDKLDQLKELDAGFRNLQARERQLSSQFSQLQAREQQAESLEHSLRQKMNEFVLVEQKIEAKEVEIEKRSGEIKAQAIELEAKEKDVRTLEQELDDIQKQIKPKTEELSKKEQQLEEYRLKLEAFNSENLKNKGELDAQVSLWQSQVKNAQAKGQEADLITQQFNKLREDANSANSQLNIAVNEKNILTQENSSLKVELNKLTEEKLKVETDIKKWSSDYKIQTETLESVQKELKEEVRSHKTLEAQFHSLQTAFYSLHENYEGVCQNYGTSQAEMEILAPKFTEASEENAKLKELISMLETQTSKMEFAHNEELQKTSTALKEYMQKTMETESIKQQRDTFARELDVLRNEVVTLKAKNEESIVLNQQPISKIAAGKVATEVSTEEFEGLVEENSKLKEDLESVMDQIKHAQEILDENEDLKDKLNNMQQDNELMAQALEEINDKIEKRQIIIVDNDGEEEGRDENDNGSQDGQVRIDDEDGHKIVRGDQGEGEEEGVEGLDEMGPAELLQYTTDELKKLKDAYDQMKEEYEQNLEENDMLRRENQELKEDLIKIVGAHEEGFGEEAMDGQEEGYENQEALGEEEQGSNEEQDDDRTNDEIIGENDQLIELLKQLSLQITALKEAYLEVINDLFSRNEQREAKGLNYTEFVNSAEEMQEQVKQSQHERGIDNMRDFNKGLRESVEFYETEKLRMIARIQKIEQWCREDEQGLEEGTDREAAEEGQEELGEEEQYQEGEGMPEQYQGEEEEVQEGNENEELSVDKLVELLLITLQLIEKIRETATTEEASENERLVSIVDSINKFEQMGDSGEGNFELATILQKIVENKISQEGAEEYADGGEEEQLMEEQEAGDNQYGQEERVAIV